MWWSCSRYLVRKNKKFRNRSAFSADVFSDWANDAHPIQRIPSSNAICLVAGSSTIVLLRQCLRLQIFKYHIMDTYVDFDTPSSSSTPSPISGQLPARLYGSLHTAITHSSIRLGDRHGRSLKYSYCFIFQRDKSQLFQQHNIA